MPRRRRLSPILVVAPLALLAWLVVKTGGGSFVTLPQSHGPDRERAMFARCSGPVRVSCVVDGDTFWYRGAKIRVADINTPEVSEPGCAAEAELGERATRRFIALLNAGPFTLEPVERATDRYGRKLFVVTRGGESLGATLEAEGLAEHWHGHRRDWC
jgi:endonuclease YncB( thermonuclease family)